MIDEMYNVVQLLVSISGKYTTYSRMYVIDYENVLSIREMYLTV